MSSREYFGPPATVTATTHDTCDLTVTSFRPKPRPKPPENAAHYLADGGGRSWDRKTCAEVGLSMLLKWMTENQDALESVVVNYDPHRVKPDDIEVSFVSGSENGPEAHEQSLRKRKAERHV